MNTLKPVDFYMKNFTQLITLCILPTELLLMLPQCITIISKIRSDSTRNVEQHWSFFFDPHVVPAIQNSF